MAENALVAQDVHGSGQSEFDPEVYRFLIREIDTVPQIEALLLVWETRPRRWSAAELSQRLYVDSQTINSITAALVERRLIVVQGNQYSYESRGEEEDRLMEAVAHTYRRDLVRCTTLIHAKPSIALREFARAFKLKKKAD